MQQILNGENSDFKNEEDQAQENGQKNLELSSTNNKRGLIPVEDFTPHRLVEEPSALLTEKPASTKSYWSWTGFYDKTLWDWMQFVASIALPAVLAVLTFQQDQLAEENRKKEQKIAESNQRHEVMTAYLDQMTGLILEKNLGQSSSSAEVKSIARARTLNTLRQLNDDGERKGQLLKFLYEADLIDRCQADSIPLQANKCQEESILDLKDARLDNTTFDIPIPLQGIDLTGASLTGANLPKIDLTKADMQQAELEGAILSGAILTDAQMRNANLVGSDLAHARMLRVELPGAVLNNAVLRSATLQDSDLSKATLINTNLQGTNLSNVDFRGADLRNADLTGSALQGAELEGAWYNEATKFPEWTNPDEQGMRLCLIPIGKECK